MTVKVFNGNFKIAHRIDWLVLWCLMPLSTIFQLSRGGQFIGEGNRRTQRKPPTYRKSLTNFITKCCTLRPVQESNPQHQW